MTHTLEEHLTEICPQCKEKHDSQWQPQFSYHTCYLRTDCSNCGYVILKKVSFMTCGKIPLKP